jgi:photosystem II stability/assembly factor-like uncharacterized protein
LLFVCLVLTASRRRRRQAVYVITSAGTLYRSADEGRNWAKQSQVADLVQAIVLTNSTDRQWFYNPVTGKVWKTSNQGLTYNQVASDKKVIFLQAHPTLANTALAIVSEGGDFNVRMTLWM